MKDTSKAALDSIEIMLDFIMKNEQQEVKKYILVINLFGNMYIHKNKFNSREEARTFALETGHSVFQFVVAEDGDFHEEEKNPYR